MKKTIANNIAVRYLKGLAIKAVTGLAGWKLILVKFLINHLVEISEQLYAWAKEFRAYAKDKAKNEKLKKDHEKKADNYDEKLKDGVTEEDQQAAIDDLLNGGKR